MSTPTVPWRTLAEIATACEAGGKFQYRLKDDTCWRDASNQTFAGLYTLSNHSLRVRPESVPRAEEAEAGGDFLCAAGLFRRQGFETDALRCNRKHEEACEQMRRDRR